jgi:hypothetical protein
MSAAELRTGKQLVAHELAEGDGGGVIAAVSNIVPRAGLTCTYGDVALLMALSAAD